MRVRYLLAPLFVTAAMLSGCTGANGVADLPAEEILSRAISALDGASSYRMKGAAAFETTTVDIEVLVAGADVEGTARHFGYPIEIIKVGGHTYVKSDQFFAVMFARYGGTEENRADALAKVKGRYVKFPGSEAIGPAILPSAKDLLKEGGAVNKGESATIDGRQAITLTYATGATLYVATTGEPYPLRLEALDGAVLDLLDFGVSASITEPPAAEVFDLAPYAAQLGGG